MYKLSQQLLDLGMSKVFACHLDIASWCIRRHVYSQASLAAFEVQSDLDCMDDAESDESTDDGILFEVLEPYQLTRCRCPQPTSRLPLVSGETEYRCFECLYAHCDQSA